ncbi:MAG TPA: TetR family transcriptional regulator [Frankiaceae bacterium]|jgi:AcrR family transcriptional regulator|nr:TetR family transcriptional regulator [Frankiaceae bacterium]
MEPRSAKGRRTRARLVEGGKVVFARDGFLSARITDIATEAGVSYGAFYHYFDSKDELFREIAEQTEVRLLAMDDLPRDNAHEHDPYERIRAANRSYLAAYRKEAKLMSVIIEVSRYDEQVRAVRDRRQEEFGDRLAASVARLQQKGLADQDVDGRYAGLALGGMVATFADALFTGRWKSDFETAVEQLTILWANALGIPRPPKSYGSKGSSASRSSAERVRKPAPLAGRQ